VQIGSAADLFERPSHTFVGHFIGSPGMNFLNGTVQDSRMSIDSFFLDIPASRNVPSGPLKLGIRPEYVRIAQPHQSDALPMTVVRVQDVGTHVLLTASVGEQSIKARLSQAQTIPTQGSEVWLQVLTEHTCFYKNEELLK
jgi:glycerol transport system ATP-binding protein